MHVKYVCSLYTTSHAAGNTEDDVRYWMFCQKRQKSECLPLTSDSLHLQIQRANYQSFIWKTSLHAQQALPEPDGHGRKATDQGWNKLWKSGRENPHYSSLPPPIYGWRSQGEQAPVRRLGHHARWPPTLTQLDRSSTIFITILTNCGPSLRS